VLQRVAKLARSNMLYLVALAIAIGAAVGQRTHLSESALRIAVTCLAIAAVTPSMTLVSARGILEASRRGREVALGLALTFVAAPAISIALSTAIRDKLLALGFVLSSVVPASSASLAYVMIAGGDLELATALAMLSIAIAAIAVPSYIELYSSIVSLSVPLAAIARSLALTMLLPLALGQGARALLLRRRALERARPALQLIAVSSILALVATLVASRARALAADPAQAAEIAGLLGASIAAALALAEALSRAARLCPRRRVAISILSATKNQSVAAAIAVTAAGGAASLAPALAPVIQPIIAMSYVKLVQQRLRARESR